MKRAVRHSERMPRLIVITILALLLPVFVNLIIANRETLGNLLQRMAMASAAVRMPDSSLGMVYERFFDSPGEESPALPPYAPGEEVDVQEAELPEPGEEIDRAPDNLQVDSSPTAQPRIPVNYRAKVFSENFHQTGSHLVAHQLAYIRNETNFSDEEILEVLQEPPTLGLEQNGAPQVLILHTHATESFERYDSDAYDTRNTWRSTDNNNNMVTVGNTMRGILEANGIGVIHDTTQHDYPSYNGSYERSAQTVQAYLNEYPSIKIVLDLHRDAMQREENIVKPVAVIDGRKAAQVMIISPCDDGTMNIPNWRENLRFAGELQNYMEQEAPEITRPVYLCYRKYNMDLSGGALLLEIGSNGNTMEEALYSAELVGQALANLIHNYSDLI